MPAVGRISMDRGYKPDSVPRVGVGHLSVPFWRTRCDQPEAYPVCRTSRHRGRGGPPPASYSILLRMGLAVRLSLRKTRWSLTPPFHPYPEVDACASLQDGLFSVALSVPFDLAKGLPRRLGRHPALRSPDFPLQRDPVEGTSPERPNPRSIDIQRTKGSISDQGCQYNIRLQKLHWVIARPFLASCMRCGGNFM